MNSLSLNRETIVHFQWLSVMKQVSILNTYTIKAELSVQETIQSQMNVFIECSTKFNIELSALSLGNNLFCYKCNE